MIVKLVSGPAKISVACGFLNFEFQWFLFVTDTRDVNHVKVSSQKLEIGNLEIDIADVG